MSNSQDYIPGGFLVNMFETPTGIDAESICFNHLYVASAHQVEALRSNSQFSAAFKYSDVMPKIPSELSEFRRLYAYLGDIPVGQPFEFDLRLREDVGAEYEIEGQLPVECSFRRGVLSGRASTPTPLLSFLLHVKTSTKILAKRFWIRFFNQRCGEASFVQSDFIQYGYGKNWVEYSSKETYFRSVNLKNVGKTGTPFEEAIEAARRIFQDAGKEPIFLFVSGGVDSQCMVQAFQAAQVPHQVVLMEDINGLNRPDVLVAREFFKSRRISPITFKIDFIQYIQEFRYLKLAFDIRFNNPEYGILLELMNQFKGYGVYAGRPISIGGVSREQRVLGLAGDESWSKARYMLRYGRRGCPEFLVSTPGLVKSCLELPIAREFDPGLERWFYEHKIEMLRQGGFDVSMAFPHKLTGFEELEAAMGMAIWTQHRFPLKKFFPGASMRATQILLPDGGVSDGEFFHQPHSDGFSWEYASRNEIKRFH